MNDLKDRLSLAGFDVRATPGGNSVVIAGADDFPRLREIANHEFGLVPHATSPIFWRADGKTCATLILHNSEQGGESRLYLG